MIYIIKTQFTRRIKNFLHTFITMWFFFSTRDLGEPIQGEWLIRWPSQIIARFFPFFFFAVCMRVRGLVFALVCV